MKLTLATAALALACGMAGAQGPAPAASSPAKKELVQKILKLQQADLQNLAQQIASAPAAQLQQQAQVAIQNRVPADKREAIWRDVQADLKKYVDDTAPQVRDLMAKVAPQVIGPLLEERFSEDELRQLVGWLESPVAAKYQQAVPDFRRALLQKLAPEVDPLIEGKARGLQQSLAKRLGVDPKAAAPAEPAASRAKK